MALGKERDEGIFWHDLLNFAGELENSEKNGAAAQIYAGMAAKLGESSLGVAARLRFDAIQGKGGFSARAEVLLRRFTQEARDPKAILPMLAGSAVYSLARTATLGRLATTTRAAWYTRGLGANFAAASVGFAAEVPTFALSSRALRNLGNSNPAMNPSLLQELESSAITLGLLKSFAFAGNQAFLKFHGFNSFGIPARLASVRPVSQLAFSQTAMFGGLLAAHKAEESLGLRQRVDGATTVTDTLASMFSMSVGGHLGNKVLGSRFANFQRELEIGAQSASRNIGTPKGLRNPFPTTVAARGFVDSKLSSPPADWVMMSLKDPEGPEFQEGNGSGKKIADEVPIEGILGLQEAVRRGDLSKLEVLGKAAATNDLAVNVLANFAEKGHLHALKALDTAAARNPSAAAAVADLAESGPLQANAWTMLIENKKTYFPHLLRLERFETIYRALQMGRYKTDNFTIVNQMGVLPRISSYVETAAIMTTILGAAGVWLSGHPFLSLPVQAIH
ncbi:MAG: hypothetical protein K8R69_00150, partial [Deltaproteobacteria bacterium]|nr:hypothetical protein [Deltaproteobacteria bacterium]